MTPAEIHERANRVLGGMVDATRAVLGLSPDAEIADDDGSAIIVAALSIAISGARRRMTLIRFLVLARDMWANGNQD